MEAQLDPDSDLFVDGETNIFQKLGMMRNITQKVLENAANEKPVISRPARAARDLIRDRLEDDSVKNLF